MDTTQLLKGVLDVAVLAALRDADGYGYGVVRTLRRTGLVDVSDGAVYGTLRRLLSAGCVTTYAVAGDEGAERTFYSLTAIGRDELRRASGVWHGFAATMATLLPAQEAV